VAGRSPEVPLNGRKQREEHGSGSALPRSSGLVPDRAAVPERPALDGLLARRDRAEDDDTERRALGLKEVDGLVARSGLHVTRETVGTPGRLSAAQEITAYRIIQESLTNTLRHAGVGAAVTLRLAFTPRGMRVEVSDDGGGNKRAAKATTARTGHGLVGMRERVAVHGGDLVVGPRAEGGWQVVATIPRR
jgi:signal transduction histidine kinase